MNAQKSAMEKNLLADKIVCIACAGTDIWKAARWLPSHSISPGESLSSMLTVRLAAALIQSLTHSGIPHSLPILNLLLRLASPQRRTASGSGIEEAPTGLQDHLELV